MSAIQLYARTEPSFDIRVNQTVQRLRAAADAHRGNIVQATSLGAEDMVITDLIARHRLQIAVATLDTGALHPETLNLMDRLEAHYQLRLERHAPEQAAVLHFVTDHGPKAMYESLELRKACCAIRKLQPLKRMLARRSAWVTGLRREQSDNRADVPLAETDADGLVKFNPLADWSWADVWHYIDQHQVPYNHLHDQFMPSIGCAPCTRAIAVGEPFRAGRWWWEDESRKECGLHVHDNAAATTTSSN